MDYASSAAPASPSATCARRYAQSGRQRLGQPALAPAAAEQAVAEQASTDRDQHRQGAVVKYRKLGSSDLEVSEISLGSWLTFAGGVELPTPAPFARPGVKHR
jgi:hypothetical protein